MRFRLYREHGALNSKPVFDAFEQGVKSLGHEISTTDGIPVIWSVLWSGRMSANQKIYQQAVTLGQPIIIIEVGNLLRGKSWRISINHIHGRGIFGNSINLDTTRPQKLGIFTSPPIEKRRDEILIASQHSQSLQWQGMPTMEQWILETVNRLRRYTDRKIVVRPHPRSPISPKIPGVIIEQPRPVIGTYDDFDINYNYHCVINHNSGPAVQAAIQGIPVICDITSLAGEISEKMENIENPILPDRYNWFLQLCHTEWTVEEIRQGIPLARLETYLKG